MGKYFANDLEAKEWAAAKFQALYRGREHRRAAERKRRDLLEAAALLVDACDVRILGERESIPGYDAHRAMVKSRRFREDAGDGHLGAMQKALKALEAAGGTLAGGPDPGATAGGDDGPDPVLLDPLARGFRGERAAHRAAENGHVACLRLAVSAGFDVDDATVLGNTAAHYAALGGGGLVGGAGANDCIRELADQLADIMRANKQGVTPINICALRGKESTTALIRALAVDGEDLVMRRRRANELRRQEDLRRKKSVLLGRDCGGGEGGAEFLVPNSAHLTEEAKYVVACGLRGRGVVANIVATGAGRAEPELARRERERREKQKKRETGRVFGFLGRGAGSPVSIASST
ncbi:hypothetical protein TeGR_g4360 [Tetraparma gracilis]|uniref:Uncharacterized protein n=1 Tax=Tetraparma gracilis TaxID=2962635 RepID=A0ABQ6N8X2_9STRA|nr:hypothetical protein TeGR_g4360 [Tetraparma gracilis]